MSSQARELVTRCGLCNTSQGNLSRCTRCKVMFYCSREHQVADRPSHKRACNRLSGLEEYYKDEEQRLRDHPGDFMMDPDPFTNSVGHFWGIHETRDYMRGRYAYVEALSAVKTRSSAEAQLDHTMDMLRLCRGDNLGVRDIVPHLMLRLDRDQDCYDFVKWWSTDGEDDDYDWGDTSLPYLNVKNADAFESPKLICKRLSDLSLAIAVCLLKVKMLRDLFALRDSATNETAIPKGIPGEILNGIQKEMVRSPLIATNKEIMSSSNQQARIKSLITQLKMLYQSINKSNKHFWPVLLDPKEHLQARPDCYSTGSLAEAEVKLAYTYDAWVETPGALSVIRSIHDDLQW